MQESNDVRDLTMEAKWETDLEKQKKSIERLGSFYGMTAIPSLEEIMTVTSREEIRQFCIDAIKGIQDKATSRWSNEQAVADGENGPKEIKKEKRRGSNNLIQRRKKKSPRKKKSIKIKSQYSA